MRLKLRTVTIISALLVNGFVNAHAASHNLKFDLRMEELPLSSQEVLQAHYLFPNSKRAPTVPLILLFGGFEEAGKVLSLITPSMPVILASFDYPFTPPRTFRFPSSLSHAPQAKQAVHATLEGIPLLVQKMKKLYPNQISSVWIIGASFGAPFALLSVAEHPGLFQGAIIVHGFLDIEATARRRIESSWKRKIGRLASPLARLVSRVGWSYLNIPEPKKQLPKLNSQQRILNIVANDDSFIPAEERAALSKALNQTQAQVTEIKMPGDHLQPGAHETIQKILSEVTGWLQSPGTKSN